MAHTRGLLPVRSTRCKAFNDVPANRSAQVEVSICVGEGKKAKHGDEMKIDNASLLDIGIGYQDQSGASLTSFLDRTHSAAGHGNLVEMLKAPLGSLDAINARQRCLRALAKRLSLLDMRSVGASLDFSIKYLNSGMTSVHQEAWRVWFICRRYPDFANDLTRGVEATKQILAWCGGSLLRLDSDGCGDLEALSRSAEDLLSQPFTRRLIKLEGRNPPKLMSLVRFHADIHLHLPALKHLVTQLGQLDALLSMASVSNEQGFTYPEIVDARLAVDVRGMFHPLVANAVRNDLVTSPNAQCLYITGPNAAGKSTYLRASALVIYLAHVGMAVPAAHAVISLYDRLSVQLSVRDSLDRGESLFVAEIRIVKRLLRHLIGGDTTFVVLDEPFKGTNVKDAEDATVVFLSSVVASGMASILVASHLDGPASRLPTQSIVYQCFESNDQDGAVLKNYTLRAGVSSQRLGMRLLEREGLLSILRELRERNETSPPSPA
jgi:DNA mismatch repair protein MutS